MEPSGAPRRIRRAGWLPVIFLVFACSSGPAVAPVKDVGFFTADANQVRGRLYDPKPSDAPEKESGPAVFGILILDGLKGWTTRAPVPSFSYWRRRGAGEAFDAKPSGPLYGYWTGDAGILCEIPAWVTIQDIDTTPDPDKLRLEYRNPGLVDHRLLGAEGEDDTGYFEASYDGKPLKILGVDIIEQDHLSIRHGLIIRSGMNRSDDDPADPSGVN